MHGVALGCSLQLGAEQAGACDRAKLGAAASIGQNLNICSRGSTVGTLVGASVLSSLQRTLVRCL